jgi:hypothetical protein
MLSTILKQRLPRNLRLSLLTANTLNYAESADILPLLKALKLYGKFNAFSNPTLRYRPYYHDANALHTNPPVS